MRLCFSVTEAEVERAKNVFKTSLFMNLDGECSFYLKPTMPIWQCRPVPYYYASFVWRFLCVN